MTPPVVAVAFVPDEPVPADLRAFLEEPDPHGDLYDFLILVGIAVLVALTIGGVLWFLEAVYHAVGMGEA